MHHELGAGLYARGKRCGSGQVIYSEVNGKVRTGIRAGTWDSVRFGRLGWWGESRDLDDMPSLQATQHSRCGTTPVRPRIRPLDRATGRGYIHTMAD